VLDPRLLTDFLDSFYGYGNPQAPLWFIGMEEGGGTVVSRSPSGVQEQYPIPLRRRHAIGDKLFRLKGSPFASVRDAADIGGLRCRKSQPPGNQTHGFRSSQVARLGAA
jgi:hypothetical protein